MPPSECAENALNRPIRSTPFSFSVRSRAKLSHEGSIRGTTLHRSTLGWAVCRRARYCIVNLVRNASWPRRQKLIASAIDFTEYWSA